MADTLDAPAPSNIPEYSVSEISSAVKRTLEGAFSRVRVRGEVTEMKRYPSGHIYFSLKDEAGKIAGIVWKGSVSRLGLVPENGIEVIATGRVTAYGERSSYQLIVEKMEFAGAGALLAKIEMLRVRLAEEGLFAESLKRPIPMLPRLVGVVTSPQGAVLQDIRTTIARRFPRDILLWPVAVQGEGSAEKIAAAIRGFSAIPADGPIPRPDVLIVARGGGSLEDLMAFNDEGVLRAVAACTIPLISAVGHETDTTLIDFVSDRRAPTPTAAAEMAVPSRLELLGDLTQKSGRLTASVARLMGESRLRVTGAARGLPDIAGLLGQARLRLDDRAERLALAPDNLLRMRRAEWRHAAERLPHPRVWLDGLRSRLMEEGRRLALGLPQLLILRRNALTLSVQGLPTGLRHRISVLRQTEARISARLSPAPVLSGQREARARLEGLSARLQSVSYQAVLERGFALVSDAGGQPVTRAAALAAGDAVTLRFADGAVGATAGEDAAGKSVAPKAARKRSTARQGSLL
ncbi:exodeoxyribonuclease VII large subunit [Acidisoma cellulosilytica]|uniref:Exodeoxyribonuclease 7 large subunit n=1 Tax=Acidisoma cellulosilyticum TaxID=2802395 RepID=A0A963YZE8_9PROT|nr:exodeoxyribonuclease VII large subunit [Acidisoma cellulosilyticum]MCB8879699.1 exodeoxyribonuclease VII large subunit [Acidisoma cellulosilyticum]